jgi:hypothetical protein
MAKRNDGIFVFAVLALAAAGASVAQLGGLGTPAYSMAAFLLMLGAGAVCYFLVKDAGAFGVKDEENALAYVGFALAAAFAFSGLLLGSATVLLQTISAAIAIACAAPLIALAVRSRSGKQKEEGSVKEAPAASNVSEGAPSAPASI